MDEFEKLRDQFVQLAKLALKGEAERARTLLLRVVREALKVDPAFAHTLRDLVVSVPEEAASAPSPLRRVERPTPTSPSDAQAIGDLLRIEDPPALSHQPVYAEAINTKLRELVREHAEPQLLRAAGLTPTRTVVLAGPPGVGKTLAARWVASSLGWPLMVLDLNSVMSRYLGATGANLKRALDYARARPCVLFLDELDAIAKHRDDHADVGELKRLVAVLLQELDEWPQGSLLMAATNHPQLLDVAVWRRFEMRMELGRPSASALQALMRVLAEKAPSTPTEWTLVLPSLLAGTSHSELERVLTRLRRQTALNPETTPSVALQGIIDEYLEGASRSARQNVALSLAQSTALSDRTISALTAVSRDKLRSTREQTPKTKKIGKRAKKSTAKPARSGPRRKTP